MHFRTLLLLSLFAVLIASSICLAEGIIFSEPVMVDAATGDFRQPSFTASMHNGLLYLQYVKEGSSSLKAYRIYVRKGLSASGPEEILEDRPNPYHPTIKSVGDRNLLYWYQDNSGAEASTDPISIMDHQIVFFDGLVPTDEEFSSQQTIFSGQMYRKRPLFQRVDSTLYIDIVEEFSRLCNEEFGCDHSTFCLRSINLNNEQLSALYYRQRMNGIPALVPHGDELIRVYSRALCVGFDHADCFSWDGLFIGATVSGDSLLGKNTLWSIEHEYRTDRLPGNIHSGQAEEGYFLGVGSNREVVSINYDAMIFSGIVDLSPYIGRTNILPIQCRNLNVIIAVDDYRFDRALNSPTLLVFDREWNFLDSASLPVAGIPNQFSEFVYLPDEDKIVFAYSSYVPDGYASDRVFIQSISLDIETDTPEQPASTLPQRFTLAQNYPNPFNPSTSIQFSLARRSEVTINIYNVLGQKVRILLNEPRPAGTHTVSWDGEDESGETVASGVYLYRIQADDFDQTKKMLLLK